MRNIFTKLLAYVLKNWKAKAGSILVAFIVFIYVHYTRNIIRVVQIRVEKPEIPENLVLSSNVQSFMNVQFEGPREGMDFPVSDFRIILSNPRPESGDNKYRTRLLPELPQEIKARYESEISVRLDHVLSRELPIDPDIDFSLDSAFQGGYTWTNPRFIVVRGPTQVLSGMDRIRTQKVIVNSKESFISQRVLISDLPEFVTLAANQPIEVDVSARILPADLQMGEGGQISLFRLPVRCLNAPPGVSLKTGASQIVDVLIGGEKSQIGADQFAAKVFCPVFFDDTSASIRPRFLIQDVPVIIEDRLGRTNVTILKVSPQRLSLQFERLQQRTPAEVQQGFEEHVIR